LRQYTGGNISRILCAEEYSNTLGTDQFYDGFYLFQKGITRFLENQVGFINE
jgi:hypothetical protein